MTDLIWNFGSFVVALGILVAVHEFGHFWVARKCGVQVDKFSIGFGKSLWKRIGKDGTEYSLSMIPLGGFVKMLDSRVDSVTDEKKHLAFDLKPLWQRSAIVSAGPLFNFIFAVFAYWAVFLIGVPSVKPVIGDVTPNSIIAQAGIESGMELTSIDGIKTANWEAVNMGLISHIKEDQLILTVSPADGYGLEQQKIVDIRDWEFNPETDSPMSTLGFEPFRPQIKLTLAHVNETGAAFTAGFKVGDKVVSANQSAISSWDAFAQIIRSNANTAIDVVVERNGQQVELNLIPDVRDNNGQQMGFAGIAPEVEAWPEHYTFELQYGPIEAIGQAVDKSKQVISLTLGIIKKLVTGDVGLNNLSGPISIAKGAGATADIGIVYFLGFLALISINLGILNLMPLPILDGGHLLFFAIEAVIRRPVPEKIQEMGYRIGGAVLFALMSIAIINDFMRL
jgi:regulator of sigma E protease